MKKILEYINKNDILNNILIIPINSYYEKSFYANYELKKDDFELKDNNYYKLLGVLEDDDNYNEKLNLEIDKIKNKVNYTKNNSSIIIEYNGQKIIINKKNNNIVEFLINKNYIIV